MALFALAQEALRPAGRWAEIQVSQTDGGLIKFPLLIAQTGINIGGKAAEISCLPSLPPPGVATSPAPSLFTTILTAAGGQVGFGNEVKSYYM